MKWHGPRGDKCTCLPARSTIVWKACLRVLSRRPSGSTSQLLAQSATSSMSLMSLVRTRKCRPRYSSFLQTGCTIGSCAAMACASALRAGGMQRLIKGGSTGRLSMIIFPLVNNVASNKLLARGKLLRHETSHGLTICHQRKNISIGKSHCIYVHCIASDHCPCPNKESKEMPFSSMVSSTD